MSLLTHMAEMDQITQPKYTLCHELGLGLTGVLPQGHNKVISRSQEGQLSLKQVK